MASDQETTAGGNRRLQETPPPPEQEVIQEYDFFDPAAPAIGAHHAPPREGPLQEIIFPDVDLEPSFETAVLPTFDLTVSLEMEAAEAWPPVLVFEKRLSSADVSRELGFRRLFIRKGWRLSLALKAEEMQSVVFGGGVRVWAADPNGIHYDLWLSAGRGGAVAPPMEYIVGNAWIGVVDVNGLKKGDRVEGWGYRVEGEFRLALHFIKEEQVQLALGI